MKILYFLDNSDVVGGAANTLIRQARLMNDNKNDVIVAIPTCNNNDICKNYFMLCKEYKLKYHIINFPVVNNPEDLDIISIIEQYTNLREYIKSIHPDVLHSVQLNPLVEIISRELYIPHVMNIYPLIPDFFKLKYIDLFPKYHICDSEYYACLWEKYCNTESVCIRTVAYSSRKKKISIFDKKSLTYICVGTVYEEKNQLEVIKAFQKALKNGIKGKLLLYGYNNGSYGEKCESYITQNNLEEFVELKGFVFDMDEVYLTSDVLLCGSTRESFPNAISEALANNLVVISTPVAGVPEVIHNGINGYLSDGFTADSIYEKIIEFNNAYKQKKVIQILENAEKTYLKEHSPESIYKKLNLYYKKLLKNYFCKKLVEFDDLKEVFAPFINIYYENEKLFINKEFVKRKIWYMYHIKDRLDENIAKKKKFYIWGTGVYGERVLEMLSIFFKDIVIEGFLDNYRVGLFKNYYIYNPEDVLERKDCIILVAVCNGQKEILNQLKKNNKRYNLDYYLLAQRHW